MCSLHYGFKTDTETCDIELGFQKSSTVLWPQIKIYTEYFSPENKLLFFL